MSVACFGGVKKALTKMSRGLGKVLSVPTSLGKATETNRIKIRD